jgi:hypothetical protein
LFLFSCCVMAIRCGYTAILFVVICVSIAECGNALTVSTPTSKVSRQSMTNTWTDTNFPTYIAHTPTLPKLSIEDTESQSDEEGHELHTNDSDVSSNHSTGNKSVISPRLDISGAAINNTAYFVMGGLILTASIVMCVLWRDAMKDSTSFEIELSAPIR